VESFEHCCSGIDYVAAGEDIRMSSVLDIMMITTTCPGIVDVSRHDCFETRWRFVGLLMDCLRLTIEAIQLSVDLDVTDGA
jgi:hypothetical protein